MEMNIQTAPGSGCEAPLRMEAMAPISLSDQALRSSHLVGFESRSLQSRPFELLRTSFAKKIAESGARMVAVTSSTPAAGKSFLSLNLAASLARVSDVPIYLVDLDLRRASLASELGLDLKSGIETFLSGEREDLGSCGYRIEGNRLVVFPATRTKLNTAELLSSSRYEVLLERLRANADNAIVLFDTPPAFAGDDAMIAIEKLDGYVMIVDSGRTTKKQMRDVRSMLSPSPCLGAILNRYRGGIGDPHGYGYGFGYSQYSRYYE